MRSNSQFLYKKKQKNNTNLSYVLQQTQGLGMQTPALLAQLQQRQQQGNQYSHQSQQY